MAQTIRGHHEWLRRVADYHSGGVSGAERAAIEAHLLTCAECREALAMYQRFYRLLRSPLWLDGALLGIRLAPDGAGGGSGSSAAHGDPGARIRPLVSSEPPSAPNSPPRRSFRLFEAIAAILVIALLGGGLVTLIHSRADSAHQPSPTPTATPARLTTGALESIPLPPDAGTGYTWVTPSPRDAETAYDCQDAPLAPPGGTRSGTAALWVTHNAGQTWGRAPLPEVSGVWCNVEPAFDGSHRVVAGILNDQGLDPHCAPSRYFLSDDDGATWRAIALTSLTPPISQMVNCLLLVTARHLFLQANAYQVKSTGEAVSILERSDDDGQTWQRADNGLPDTSDVLDLQPLDATGEALVMLGTSNSNGFASSVDLRTTHDAGAHWQRVTSGTLPAIPQFGTQFIPPLITEPAGADAARMCHCVIVVRDTANDSSGLNKHLYVSRDLVHWTALPPLPVKGASANLTGVRAALSMTGDGRLLALGPEPGADLTTLISTSPQVLWVWDTHTGRWQVARTSLPCLEPQDCSQSALASTGVSVVARATGQPSGTWFWFKHENGRTRTQLFFRVFIPAA